MNLKFKSRSRLSKILLHLQPKMGDGHLAWLVRELASLFGNGQIKIPFTHNVGVQPERLDIVPVWQYSQCGHEQLAPTRCRVQ